MIIQMAYASKKVLTDLETQANACLLDPTTNDMTMVSKIADVNPLVSQAKKSEGSLAGIIEITRKATENRS